MIIVVGLENQQVAVHPARLCGIGLELTAKNVESELIKGTFIPLPQEEKYPEAISALLDATNNWIAARDSKTAAIQVTSVAAKPSSSAWFPAIVLGVVVLAIGLIGLVWAWVVYRRSRDRVGARLKEIKSQAVEVMDRLDGLKERLKLLPTAPGFSRAMSGQTLDFYNTVEAKVGKLWDGWLGVMDVLDKAQKLAARSGSLLSQKTLSEAEELMTRQGSFQEIESQAKAISTEIDRLDHAHEAANVVLEKIKTARPKIAASLEAVKKVDLPTAPYQPDVDAVDAGVTQASALVAPDPLGTKVILEQLQSQTEGLESRIERVVALVQDARQVKASLESIRRQTAGHRCAMLPGSSSRTGATRISRAVRARRSARGAALRTPGGRSGCRAAQKLDQARAMVQDAQCVIEKVQKSRAFCEREQPARSAGNGSAPHGPAPGRKLSE